ncbi:hypothetical protein AYI70_g10594, partial [Smittium culicis]
MTNEKPIKRARNTFSDVLKGNIPHGTPKPTIIKKNESKKMKYTFRYDQKIDMSQYRDVSVKHLLYGGKQTSLKRLCQNGSDRKIGIPWSQFQGDHMNALYKLAHDLDGCIYIRKDDHQARITYLIFSKKEDAQNVMQKTFSHNLKEIEMYQTEKLEEDITVVNIPNLGDVDILTLPNLIKDTLEPTSEIIDISALCRKGLTKFLPYGVKILLRKKYVDTIIPSFLDYEYGKINIFYRGCKEACSYCKQEGHRKSICEFLKNKSRKNPKKNPNETLDQTYDQIKGTAEADIEPDVQSGADEPRYVDQEPPKPLGTEQRRGTVRMKRPPASSIAMAESRKAEKTDAQPDDPVLQNSLGQNSVPKKHGKNISENIGNYNANNRTEKKYKKIIIPSTLVSEDSYGYSTPTELEIMAEKARNDILTEVHVKPDVLALQETFFTKSTYRFRLPWYTCIESKANLIKGGTGLLPAVRNKSGLQISEFQSSQTWLSGIIYGKKINGDKFEAIVTNVHIPSTGIRRLKASNEIFSLINKAKLKFKKNIILGDFNMDIKGANKFDQKLGASYSRAKVANSTGSRWNKNKIGRMIDHIFYAGFTSRENWCTASKKVDMSDHMPIMAQWSIDVLKDT